MTPPKKCPQFSGLGIIVAICPDDLQGIQYSLTLEVNHHLKHGGSFWKKLQPFWGEHIIHKSTTNLRGFTQPESKGRENPLQNQHISAPI